MMRFPNAARYFALGLLAVSVISSCSKHDQDARAESREVVFQVNDSLLVPAAVEPSLHLQFSVPSGWDRLPEQTLNQVLEKLRTMVSNQDSVEIIPVMAFLKASSGCCCVVSRWQAAVGDSAWLIALHRTKDSISQRFGSEQVRQTAFDHRGFKVFQFLIMTDDRVAFKLLLHVPGRDVIQVDYVTPRSAYPQEVRSIESSIGSVRYSG